MFGGIESGNHWWGGKCWTQSVIGTEPSAYHVVSAIGGVTEQSYWSSIKMPVSGWRQPFQESLSPSLRTVCSCNSQASKGLNPQNVSSVRYREGTWEIAEVNHAFQQFQDLIEISSERFSTIYRQGQILVYVTQAGSSTEAAYSLDNNGSRLKRIR